MKILNYGISYIEDGTEKSMIIFSKLDLIETYIKLLRTPMNISSLKCFLWQGIRDSKYKDITAEVNKFLYR